MGKAKQKEGYELEYKIEPARMVKGGPTESVIGKVSHFLKTSLENWYSLCSRVQLKSAGDKLVQIFRRST